MLKSLVHKLSVVLKMIRFYKNWPSLILYRLNVRPQPMVVKMRDGARFEVRDRRDELSDAYVINESYLYGIHDNILPYFKNAKVGFDVGAHIGAFTIFAAKKSPARIFAVEPAPNNRKVLEENIKLNNFEDRIKVLPVAVSSRGGEIDLFIPENGGIATTSRRHLDLYNADVGTKTIKVPTKTLLELFRENGVDFCDFVKMDCEGAEYDIFYNAPQELFDKIGVMTIECHKDGNINELMDFIRKRGFEVVRPTTEFGEIFCVNRAVKI